MRWLERILAEGLPTLQCFAEVARSLVKLGIRLMRQGHAYSRISRLMRIVRPTETRSETSRHPGEQP
jgi:hypothetical protein